MQYWSLTWQTMCFMKNKDYLLSPYYFPSSFTFNSFSFNSNKYPLHKYYCLHFMHQKMKENNLLTIAGTKEVLAKGFQPLSIWVPISFSFSDIMLPFWVYMLLTIFLLSWEFKEWSEWNDLIFFLTILLKQCVSFPLPSHFLSFCPCYFITLIFILFGYALLKKITFPYVRNLLTATRSPWVSPVTFEGR